MSKTTDERFIESALETDFEEIDGMSEEQVTLALARAGHSPEDVRQALDRTLENIDAALRSTQGTR